MKDLGTAKRPTRPPIALAGLLALAVGFRLLMPQTVAADPAQGAFFTRTYRNLFVEAGYTPQEVSNRVYATFLQLFHGDPQSQAVYFPAGTNTNGSLAYIYDINNRDVRSEGVSYGMMITVQLDRKAEFDGLWNWAKSHMYHASSNHPACGYFSWSLKTNGVPNDEMPAPDGEEYFATSGVKRTRCRFVSKMAPAVMGPRMVWPVMSRRCRKSVSRRSASSR